MEDLRFVSFATRELCLAKEGRGCLLDGRRLAVLEAKPLLEAKPRPEYPDNWYRSSSTRFALVPASAKEGDLIHYHRRSTFGLVLRPLGGEHSLPTRETRAFHLVGVCLSEITYSPTYESFRQIERHEHFKPITIC